MVARSLAAWQLPVVKPHTTIGVPWTAEQYAPEIERLHAALVTPFKQRFELAETDDPDQKRVRGEAIYWVVAETPEIYVWYDEFTAEFGVGERIENALPRSIGLRGDIVGSFCAW